MIRFRSMFLFTALSLTATAATADGHRPGEDSADALRAAAVEALIAAPPERALPIARRVLDGPHDDALKEKALFVLSQIDAPEANAAVLAVARDADNRLQRSAIRMLGIGGNADAVAALDSIYAGGDSATRSAVLEALMIAGERERVLAIALEAEGRDFADAVQMLGAMDAHDELRVLRERLGSSAALIQAFAIAGDADELQVMAQDASDPAMQSRAIEALGIVGGPEVSATLTSLYREASDRRVRAAALQGLLIAGDDQAMLDLYRESTDPVEKKRLLQHLVMTGSDAAWEAIDAALEAQP